MYITIPQMKHNSQQTSVVTDGLIKLSVADDVQEEQSDERMAE